MITINNNNNNKNNNNDNNNNNNNNNNNSIVCINQKNSVRNLTFDLTDVETDLRQVRNLVVEKGREGEDKTSEQEERRKNERDIEVEKEGERVGKRSRVEEGREFPQNKTHQRHSSQNSNYNISVPKGNANHPTQPPNISVPKGNANHPTQPPNISVPKGNANHPTQPLNHGYNFSSEPLREIVRNNSKFQNKENNKTEELQEKREIEKRNIRERIKFCPMCNYCFPENISNSELDSHIYKCLN